MMTEFLDVLEFAISETKASEKIQANAIRAIGNFGMPLLLLLMMMMMMMLDGFSSITLHCVMCTV
jgi:hypothetical protein